MTTTVRGLDNLHRFLATLPEKLEKGVLKAGLKAGAEVIADEAKLLCRSSEVRESIETRVTAKDGVVSAKVQTIGEGAYKAPWLEFGTDPHFITVQDEAREGRTIKRINKLNREGSLVIGGKFVGASVFHPGARPYPFLRPAADTKEGEAIDVIGETIRARLTKQGIDTTVPDE